MQGKLLKVLAFLVIAAQDWAESHLDKKRPREFTPRIVRNK